MKAHQRFDLEARRLQLYEQAASLLNTISQDPHTPSEWQGQAARLAAEMAEIHHQLSMEPAT